MIPNWKENQHTINVDPSKIIIKHPYTLFVSREHGYRSIEGIYTMTLSNTTKIVKNIKCIEFRDFFNADLVNATFCLFITMFSRKILVFRRRILSSVDDPSWFSFFSQFSFYSYYIHLRNGVHWWYIFRDFRNGRYIFEIVVIFRWIYFMLVQFC